MKRKDAAIGLIVLVPCLYLIYKQHIYWAAAIIFGHCLYRFIPIAPQVLKVMKSAISIKFYNVVIWFLAYVLSLKLLSFTTGIDEDNLKFAPAVLAVPLSFVLLYIITMIVSGLLVLVSHAVWQFSLLLPGKIHRGVANSRFVDFSERFPGILFLMLPGLMLIVLLIPFFVTVGLLADARFVSDCAPRSKDAMYLRIDDAQCYRFALGSSLFTGEPEVIESHKK
jgi:hypothetical protein